MIARTTTHHQDRLMDATALTLLLGRSHSTIRLHCTPVACDTRTKRPLYSAVESSGKMDGIKTRNRGRSVSLDDHAILMPA